MNFQIELFRFKNIFLRKIIHCYDYILLIFLMNSKVKIIYRNPHSRGRLTSRPGWGFQKT